ncbi:MAG: hypothetical protein ACLFTK_02695 [Anaerolineales bacterium]
MTPNEQDSLQLSAYIDDELAPQARAALEARLAQDADLRAELDDLRATVALLREMPTLRAPRDYTLTPEMLGEGSPSQGRSGGGRVVNLALWVPALAAMFVAVIGLVFFLMTLAGDEAATQFDNADQAFEAPPQPTSVVPLTDEAMVTDVAQAFATATQQAVAPTNRPTQLPTASPTNLPVSSPPPTAAVMPPNVAPPDTFAGGAQAEAVPQEPPLPSGDGLGAADAALADEADTMAAEEAEIMTMPEAAGDEDAAPADDAPEARTGITADDAPPLNLALLGSVFGIGELVRAVVRFLTGF